MKLLWDQNLSPRLVNSLADLFPDSMHVRDLAMARADDDRVWAFAAKHGCARVSKDSDFVQRALLQGPPPETIWLRCGNCSTDTIESLLREHHASLCDFLEDEAASCLVLGPL